MPTLEELKSLAAKLKVVEGWPTTLDGRELVERVAGVLAEGRSESCRSHTKIRQRITMRHRKTGLVVHPSTSDVKWALSILRARKAPNGCYALNPGCPWEPKMPPPLKPAKQPSQGALELIDEWY